MFNAYIMYCGNPSQCGRGFVNRAAAMSWVNTKFFELATIGVLDPGYTFDILAAPEEDAMELARRLR